MSYIYLVIKIILKYFLIDKCFSWIVCTYKIIFFKSGFGNIEPHNPIHDHVHTTTKAETFGVM